MLFCGLHHTRGLSQRKRVKHETPELYHLLYDPSEKYNIAKDHPEVIEQIRKLVTEHQKTVKPVVNQLEIPLK